jgi:transcriptional regulator with XRE-family HTH domain
VGLVDNVVTASVGRQLREWRERRRLSQLELASTAGVSPRHLSFVETGRSRPTSTMILRLAEHLDVPLRERNRLLLAGGFAPAHPERSLGEPSMSAVHDALERLLEAHAPFPALVVDRGWDLVSANDPVYALLAGVPASLLEPPVNVIRLTLHEDGLASRIANLAEWRDHLLHRACRRAPRHRRRPAATAARRAGSALRPVGRGVRFERARRTALFTSPRSGRAVDVQHDHGLRHAQRGDRE